MLPENPEFLKMTFQPNCGFPLFNPVFRNTGLKREIPPFQSKAMRRSSVFSESITC